MADSTDKINQLLEKLEILKNKQDSFSKEIQALRIEIEQLKTQAEKGKVEEKLSTPLTAEPTFKAEVKEVKPPRISEPQTYARTQVKEPKTFNFEKFIGENLLNKIGIAITVIGVAIGVKYSIEHQLLSPLTRIIFGYLIGIALLAIGIRLKENYKNYSAVLVSGAMAMMYFITFSAYSFYGLIPQSVAFLMMVLFTAFTVAASIHYNLQVIAHIGLVGAYAVPFLLSEGSGKVAVLFSYMAIINIGILLISFKKYWKPLYYSSFILSWIIYAVWYLSSYQTSRHFVLALVFLFVFFATFYAIFLAYKLPQKEKFNVGDVALLLANSFIFYGLGYAVLSSHQTGGQLLGLFTLGNALVHFGVSAVIFKKELADRNLFYLVAGLVLIFITIAIPVQLNGHWVTLLWAFEAALLFWIGRAKKVSYYEILSYPLMILALFSLIQDWMQIYLAYDPKIIPLVNIGFLTSLLFIASLVIINYLNRKYESLLSEDNLLRQVVNYAIPVMLLAVLYYAFRLEIACYWNQLYTGSFIEITRNKADYPSNYWNEDYGRFKTIWLLNYTMFFFAVLSFVNIQKIKNRYWGYVNLILNGYVILAFLTLGLYTLSELRESYVHKTLTEFYKVGIFNIVIRYISLAFLGLLIFSVYKYIKQAFLKAELRLAFDYLLHISLVWILSSELIAWLDIAGTDQMYKLGLSILWGVYALFLIVLGIWKDKKHLRIGAFILLGVTLIKLFFYDISHLNTLSKTIVFLALGVLMLIVSFLYNKYKHLISVKNDDEN